MEVELRLKVKGVTIDLSPTEARELVCDLSKLTGQRVDEVQLYLQPYPVWRPQPSSGPTWSDPGWYYQPGIATGSHWTSLQSSDAYTIEAREVS